jgi:hypothetical protein
MRQYEIGMDTWLRGELNSAGSANLPTAPLVLVDVPFEPGSTKLGDDIFVSTERDGDHLRTLSAFSPVVRGVNENFTRDLQRLRVFVHPDIASQLPTGMGSALYGRLRKLLNA